ncbi:hypothetical protein LguiB_023584 [Lonicera macranthoides]
MFVSSNYMCKLSCNITGTQHFLLWGNTFLQNPKKLEKNKYHFQPLSLVNCMQKVGVVEAKVEDKQRSKWVKKGPDITEVQKQAISQLPPKMTNRCKALMKQIICFSSENTSLSVLLATWVKSTKPRRADWLSVLKELSRMNHPLYFEVAELALLEESLEVNVRDYTKIIHGYAKQNQLQDAENTLLAMKRRGFMCDQVILTALIHMYSKSGNLKQAEDTFEDMKLLGSPLDRRSYGSMIMAYIRAEMLGEAESLLREMEAEEIYAGREVYKALLRAYSMIGDSKGAQRIFDAIQLAAIIPDVKVCGLLINAYVVAGQSREACIVFENLRRAGLKPNDKCVALILGAYEREKKLNKALDFLIDLERNGIMVEKEASEVLARWFRSLGVVEEVEHVLREYAPKEAECEVSFLKSS